MHDLDETSSAFMIWLHVILIRNCDFKTCMFSMHDLAAGEMGFLSLFSRHELATGDIYEKL